jgi:hypothetical protein
MKVVNRAFILAAVSAMCLVSGFFSSACAAVENDGRAITVTGDAEVRVAPDEVILTLGVETWNEILNIAKKENDERVAAILTLGREHGIEEKHIQTDYISIEPRFEHQWEHRNFVGYFVRKTVIFTLRDISKFEDLLSQSLESGANYVQGIQFRTTKLRAHRDEARALAIKAAGEKAHDLASELDQKIGDPIMIREDHTGWWSPYNSWWGHRGSNWMAQNVVQNVGGGIPDSEGSISLGQIVVSARVTVSFELE